MTLRLRRFVLTCCFTTGCLASIIVAGPVDALESAVWEMRELNDGSARFQSQSTYVIAARHSTTDTLIRAYDATIFVGDWSVRASELTIDPTVDAVKFTVLRTDATSAVPKTQE